MPAPVNRLKLRLAAGETTFGCWLGMADAYAAEHTAASDLTRALVKLYEDNASTLTPDPIHSMFYDSHPPAAVRIAHLQSLPARTT